MKTAFLLHIFLTTPFLMHHVTTSEDDDDDVTRPPPHRLDDTGYVIYCPCMGRFGNQADQFLGALAFAKGLNRTLVLPPWVTYPSRKPFTSLQIAFNKWFKVKPLQWYHRVVLMGDFMWEAAPRVWPPGMRTGFCYRYRDGKTCPMKQGNPFGPFWDHFGISFDRSTEHEGLHWYTLDERVAKGWNTRFPPEKFPVLAMHGTPGSFPSDRENQYLQQYINFSDHIMTKANDFIAMQMNGEKFIGVHLRNGIDMTRVCEDIPRGDYERLFSSAQCTGFDRRAPLTKDMCNPPRNIILHKVKHYIETIAAKVLFVATDNNAMVSDFEEHLGEGIKIVTRPPEDEVDDPIVDLAILSESDLFVGNCVSSFSAFVRRQRESRNKKSDFFASGIDYSNNHDEL